MDAEAVEMAKQSLLDELSVKYQLTLLPREIRAVLLSGQLGSENFLIRVPNFWPSSILPGGQIPSNDQKFLSESNASERISMRMVGITNKFVIFDSTVDP